MPKKEATVRFSVSGWVTQRVEIFHPDITPEKLQDMLNNGDALTTIQEDGSITTAAGDGIGKVLSVDNECEYEDFEVEAD